MCETSRSRVGRVTTGVDRWSWIFTVLCRAGAGFLGRDVDHKKMDRDRGKVDPLERGLPAKNDDAVRQDNSNETFAGKPRSSGCIGKR